MNPYHHALSSAKKYGGKPEDFQEIHAWFDESKSYFPDIRHRALRHHAEGIFLAERIFGPTITNSQDRVIPTRFLGEQHVKEDHGWIPTVQDWLKCLMVRPWMLKSGIEPPGVAGNATERAVDDRLTERELGTLLAALRFWQNHGPPQPNGLFNRLESGEQDPLDEIRTGSGRFTPLTAEEIDGLCERLNIRQHRSGVCKCELPGDFFSGVPGIIAQLKNARLVPGAKVERCDSCQRYESDEAARQKLIELGMA